MMHGVALHTQSRSIEILFGLMAGSINIDANVSNLPPDSSVSLTTILHLAHSKDPGVGCHRRAGKFLVNIHIEMSGGIGDINHISFGAEG